jgi:hypothetical protein
MIIKVHAQTMLEVLENAGLEEHVAKAVIFDLIMVSSNAPKVSESSAAESSADDSIPNDVTAEEATEEVVEDEIPPPRETASKSSVVTKPSSVRKVPSFRGLGGDIHDVANLK